MIGALIWLSLMLVHMTGCYIWEIFREKPVKVRILALLALINFYSIFLVFYAL